MEILNKALYWVSTGLMVPVVIVLLFMFLRALVLTGSFYGAYITRLKTNRVIEDYLKDFDNKEIDFPKESMKKSVLFKPISNLIQYKHSDVYKQKVVADFELECEQSLALTKSLAKLGPILGLMGTLIPMGPALVGLAAGDIASMAENMQVAFSTTVVGLVVGGIGYILNQVRQRWCAKDLSTLIFVADLISESNEKAKESIFE